MSEYDETFDVGIGDVILITNTKDDLKTVELIVEDVCFSGTWVSSRNDIYFADEGWSLVNCVTPAPPIELPTVVGAYEARLYPIRSGFSPYLLDDTGEWTCAGRAVDIFSVLPIHLLGRRAVVADEVLQFMQDLPRPTTWTEAVTATAKEFGVSS